MRSLVSETVSANVDRIVSNTRAGARSNERQVFRAKINEEHLEALPDDLWVLRGFISEVERVNPCKQLGRKILLYSVENVCLVCQFRQADRIDPARIVFLKRRLRGLPRR